LDKLHGLPGNPEQEKNLDFFRVEEAPKPDYQQYL